MFCLSSLKFWKVCFSQNLLGPFFNFNKFKLNYPTLTRIDLVVLNLFFRLSINQSYLPAFKVRISNFMQPRNIKANVTWRNVLNQLLHVNSDS